VPGFLPFISYGFLLGWSVAWPPGPINAEMVRRGLARGFWPAYGLGLGACSGDALWAVAVVAGAGLLIGGATARAALGLLSTALLLLLAILFLVGAWRGIRRWRADTPAPSGGHFEGARGGYFLGLTMALTSPWNIAFWLAVIGRPQTVQGGPAAALIVAGSVILGAALWCLVLCTCVVVLRMKFAGALWEVIAKAVTGLLMLYFAASGVWRLLQG